MIDRLTDEYWLMTNLLIDDCEQQKASEQSAAAGTGSGQPSTLVDLFVSVEKIMVLNTDLQVYHWRWWW